MIFGGAASGLPSLRVRSSRTARSRASTSAGTSSRVTYCGACEAMWSATSVATARPGRVSLRVDPAELDEDADRAPVVLAVLVAVEEPVAGLEHDDPAQ